MTVTRCDWRRQVRVTQNRNRTRLTVSGSFTRTGSRRLTHNFYKVISVLKLLRLLMMLKVFTPLTSLFLLILLVPELLKLLAWLK